MYVFFKVFDVREKSLKRSRVSRSAGGRGGGATELVTDAVSWELESTRSLTSSVAIWISEVVVL